MTSHLTPRATRSRTRRPRTSGTLAAAAALGLLLSGCAGSAASTTSAAVSTAGWHGVEPQQQMSRPEFTLRDTSGNLFDFAEQTAGQPTYLYFGYTNCPDECPTAMADIATALRQTPVELREKVRVVLVTTDPERDTPPVLRDWLAKFSTRITGLVGSKEEVAAAQEAAGAPVGQKGADIPTLPGKPNEHEHKPGTAPHTHDGPLGYSVSHANVIFAYSADNTLPVVYPGGVTPADIAADLPRLATKGASR